jgi:transglutaminase-like putative cysteine protease
MTQRYRVTHRTTYSYDEDVTDSLGVAHLVPRSLPWQEVAAAEVTVTPEPGDLTHDSDHYGNTATYFQVTRGHRRLEVAAVSEVAVAPPAYDDAALAVPWERARPLVAPTTPGAWRATDFALPSAAVERVPEAHEYAAVSLRRGRPVGEAATDLIHRIHADFDYDQKATTVTSTVPEILAQRAGVCQDFAHLTIACLRSHGLAARYVSGYLATDPPPGKDRIVGADASHAWVAVWAPSPDGGDGCWLALDPTNDQRAGERYVTLAWGRDYGDVPPVKGVIFTEAKRSTLRVSVDVAPL